MEEGSSCQDHGELTGVVGVVEPGLMVDVPCVIPPRKTYDAISGLTPHSETPREVNEIFTFKSVNEDAGCLHVQFSLS